MGRKDYAFGLYKFLSYFVSKKQLKEQKSFSIFVYAKEQLLFVPS